ncbi:MAG TPA: triose-phosphate isomerase, partial [Bacteroidia bacterium]|nr:triose-phosphate isomerase [Bacteroidia bacterium]
TGVNATPAQAQEMHAFIRKSLAEKFGKPMAESIPILYGGSCNALNAAEIFEGADIDGGLIGGASLRVDEFAKIRRALLGRLKNVRM